MANKFDQRFLKQYESPLRKPKWKFVLIYGIAWVIPVMAIMIPLDFFVFNKGSFTPGRLAASISIWLAGSIIYGAWLRWYVARKTKAVKQNSTESGF